MIFEPSADEDGDGESVFLEDGAIDDGWPDEPPSAAPPVQLATVPPPPSGRAKRAVGVERARWNKGWLAVAALASLCAAWLELRAHHALGHSTPATGAATSAMATETATATATTTTTTTATATETATAMATEVASETPIASAAPSATSAPSAVDSAPPIEEPPPAAQSIAPTAFDAAAAKEALEATANAIARCQKGHVFGPGHSIVTFGNDGTVRRCAVSPPFMGTSAGMCVTRALSQARVPPFVGEPGVVVFHFTVAE